MNVNSQSPRPRALIVDDTASLLSCFELLLRPLAATWDLLFAPGATEALEITRQSAVDVVVCDLNMPVMQGDEVLASIKSAHPDTVCFLMTGCASDDSLVSCQDGLAGIFHKPCDINQIKAALDSFIASQFSAPINQAA
jgi:CheY-like chemotaxis protein